MTTGDTMTPKQKRPPRRIDGSKSFDDLTPLQQRVVKFMVDNGKSQWDAVNEGLVSEASVALWRKENIMAWCDSYRATIPPTPEELAARAREGLNALLNSSIRVVQDTLVNGEGNPTSLKAAQWVLDGIFAQAAPPKKVEPARGMEPQNAEAELAAVLQLVKR